MTRIMLLDDETSILRALRRSLKVLECDLDIFDNPNEALAALDSHRYTVIVSDYRMPEMDGVTFLKQAKDKQPHAVRLILSGYTDVQGLLGAINEAEIYRFIAKPWDDVDLQITLAKTLEYASLLATNRQLIAKVREQEAQINQQQKELERLERESPGITQVERTEDGYIILDEHDT